jgi:hypothetical protein
VAEILVVVPERADERHAVVVRVVECPVHGRDRGALLELLLGVSAGLFVQLYSHGSM